MQLLSKTEDKENKTSSKTLKQQELQQNVGIDIMCYKSTCICKFCCTNDIRHIGVMLSQDRRQKIS